MNETWSRVLIGTGVIVAFLTLGALEMLTTRLPADGPLSGQASLEDGNTAPSQDVLDIRVQLAGHDLASERGETGAAMAAAEGTGSPR